MPQSPVFCNVFYDTAEAARAADCGAIRLGVCGVCGMVYNTAFEAERMRYNDRYENSLFWSPKFRRYAGDLADELVRRHGLREKRIVEIGCGDGQFLSLLCERGGNSGLGFDPAYRAGQAPLSHRVEVRATALPANGEVRADAVYCRQVLEHVERPEEFVRGITSVIADCADGVLFIEVPSAMFILRDLSVWDIVYEHCSYFSAPSLAALLSRCGFAAADISRRFGGQYLTAVARRNGVRSESHADAGEVVGLTRTFGQTRAKAVETWRGRLAEWSAAGRRVAIWGAGSKGVMFLSTLGATTQQACAAVDLNPRKQGRYLPVTGHRVVSPREAAELRLDIVVAMNPIYRDEIAWNLRELGMGAQVLTSI